MESLRQIFSVSAKADLIKDRDKQCSKLWKWDKESQCKIYPAYHLNDGTIHSEPSISKRDLLLRCPKEVLSPSRFSYCVPRELVSEVVKEVPEEFGIYEAIPLDGKAVVCSYPYVRLYRQAKRLHRNKVTRRVYFDVLRSCYYRYLDKV